MKGRCLNRLTTEPIGVVFAAELGNKCILSQVAMECKCFFEKIQKILYSSNFSCQSGLLSGFGGWKGMRDRQVLTIKKNLAIPSTLRA